MYAWKTNLPSDLRVLKDEIEGHARDYGLDFYETIFEVIDADELHQIAAYGGFPTRYPHWSFGMSYEELKKSYDYGLSKIYEMVINNDPCYAYLMRCNHVMDQKLVMAHVYGHCDFFKNNQYFSHTSRKMMDEIANHATRIRGYVERYGEDLVEEFLDCCMSVDDLIDIHSTAIKRRGDHSTNALLGDAYPAQSEAGPVVGAAKEYMNWQRASSPATKSPESLDAPLHYPSEPMRDVLLFLLEHAPLTDWQRDILAIVRDESYYFRPQGQTKILNEGWASYWHSTIMTQKVLDSSELIDYADHHSGTMATNGRRLNPYKLGIELLRDVEYRWNTGRFGPEWDACDDLREKQNWNRPTGLGRQKIFEIRRIHNDITFIDHYLTPEFCMQHRLFSFAYQDHPGQFVIESREFQQIKQRLLFSLTNSGKPEIEVMDGNFRNRSELLLRHRFNGVDLKLSETREVLVNLQRLWRRPVHLETVVDGKPTLLSFDGNDHSMKSIGETDEQRRASASKSR
ncbi:SpoVR family protein [Tuwongella immobilis]|uniref:SpoVR family protein n=1 Tax=Tuwongella immobilis TaxID=692036 RepID=A0A6C2YRN4_9BACT|nr:SpoVR family protein [Tuwongella immobilis]VIP03783.1 Hypothetical conserved protein OS=uncultured planctomycete GN=HGMM_F13D05C23 PE=4 SV=1: SpoVR [Tuwongella immobilis]VTS04934.1 Hypothetical conserved protein OS=uncultured planctomycete GN=HGMM_F13D05C23 PE=4 SV=1: SpoVR [Tuwongella immobilis]